MKKYSIYLLAIFCLCASVISAQPETLTWKKRIKEADDLFAKGDFSKAGAYYLSAYKERTSRPDLAYQAGNCFLRIRDYKNASDAFAPIKDKNGELDQVGYKHAMSLKHMGEYKEAITAFEAYIDQYKKADRDQVYNDVLNEVSGCMLAIEQQKNQTGQTFIRHLGYNVNSDQTEFAPIIISDKVIYFSSLAEGTAKIYRSEKVEKEWSKRDVPGILNQTEQPHYGNGAFTPDGQRFYFTQCGIDNQNQSVCALYVIEKEGRGWSDPEKLPDFINQSAVNNTHPFVIFEENKEVLYFSSNRAGGQGGMDLWYVIKTLAGSAQDFSLPVNLGNTVNTAKDEITPFFDATKQTMYFASNGHINLGGFDIFRSKGNKTTWATPSNLGLPYNSSADDLYYTPKFGANQGFIVSNRIVRPDKLTTLDDDIFAFGQNTGSEKIIVNVRGKIFDYNDSSIESIPGTKVNLYEVNADDSQTLKQSMLSTDGTYAFEVEAGYHFRIEGVKTGYLKAFFDLMTFEVDEDTEIEQDIPLEQSSDPILAEGSESSANETLDPPTSIEAPPIVETESPDPALLDDPQPSIPEVPATEPSEPTIMTESGPIVPSPTESTTTETPTVSTEEANTSFPVAEENNGVAVRQDEQTTLILPIDSKTGLPAPGMSGEFTEWVPLYSLTSIEQDALINTINPNRAYLRRNDYWVPVDLTYKESADGETMADGNSGSDNTESNGSSTDPIGSLNDSEHTDPPPFPSNSNSSNAMAVEYRIQMAAVLTFKPEKYSRVEPMGELIFESIQTTEGDLSRVMLGGYASQSEARADLSKVKTRGFRRAFMIRYENGQRVGKPIR